MRPGSKPGWPRTRPAAPSAGGRTSRPAAPSPGAGAPPARPARVRCAPMSAASARALLRPRGARARPARRSTAGRSASHSASPSSAAAVADRHERGDRAPAPTGSSISSSCRRRSSTACVARTRASSTPAEAAADSSRTCTVTAPRSTAARTARADLGAAVGVRLGAADLEIEAAVVDGADLDAQPALARLDGGAAEPGHARFTTWTYTTRSCGARPSANDTAGAEAERGARGARRRPTNA